MKYAHLQSICTDFNRLWQILRVPQKKNFEIIFCKVLLYLFMQNIQILTHSLQTWIWKNFPAFCLGSRASGCLRLKSCIQQKVYFCLRTSAKDQGITWVVVVCVLVHLLVQFLIWIKQKKFPDIWIELLTCYTTVLYSINWATETQIILMQKNFKSRRTPKTSIGRLLVISFTSFLKPIHLENWHCYEAIEQCPYFKGWI